MPEPQPFIVGRQSEVERFAALMRGHVRYWLLRPRRYRQNRRGAEDGRLCPAARLALGLCRRHPS